MFSGMCDEVGRSDISHKCCNVDTVKGSVKHILFEHGRGCTNFKISYYCIMIRQAIYNCGCLDVFARGASFYDVEPRTVDRVEIYFQQTRIESTLGEDGSNVGGI